MSALSRDWTSGRFHKLAMADLEAPVNDALEVHRFDLQNKSIGLVSNLFYDLMSNAYMTPVTLVPDTLGRYAASGTGTWTAATFTLVFATMNTSFTVDDVGKLIAFRIGASIYQGVVATFVSTTTVTVSGYSLPVADGTVNDVLLISSAAQSRAVGLNGLRIMRTGQQIKLELESTATTSIEWTTSQAVFKFDPSSNSNANKIVVAYTGDQLVYNFGNGLTNAGTFTLRYPRVPYLVSQDGDGIDLPDGAPIEIAHLHYKRTLAARLKLDAMAKDATAEYAGLITALYRTFNQEATAEVIKDKILALK